MPEKIKEYYTTAEEVALGKSDLGASMRAWVQVPGPT